MTRRTKLLLAALAVASVATVAAVAVEWSPNVCGDAFAEVHLESWNPAIPASADRVEVPGSWSDDRRVRWVVGGLPRGSELVPGGAQIVLRDLPTPQGYRLRGYDPATGELEWERQLATTDVLTLPIDGATALVAGTEAPEGRTGPSHVGVVDGTGRLVACRSFPGDRADDRQPGVAVGGDGDRVVVATATVGGSRIASFDGADLTPGWTVTAPVGARAVTVAGDTVIAYRSTGTQAGDPAVMAFDAATGVERWRRTVGELARTSGLAADAVDTVFDAAVVGDRVVLTAGRWADEGNRVAGRVPFAVRAVDGTPVWHRPGTDLGTYGTVTATHDAVVLTNVDRGHGPVALALDPLSGADRWVSEGRATARPVIGARAVYLAGRPTAVDPTDGTETALADGVSATGVATGTGVVVFGFDELMVALDDQV